MIEKMGLYSFSKEGFEADDVIASAVKKHKNEYLINIVSHDKDLYQLIDENVRIYSPAKKALYDRDGCFEKYGVFPEQIRDFLAICGDTADNIPGVKGIGDKGAKKLLDEFGSLEGIYENITDLWCRCIKRIHCSADEKSCQGKRLRCLHRCQKRIGTS